MLLPVIAVRVSGGHLCEAEAPTEPAGETAVRRAAIRSPSPVIAKVRVSGGHLCKAEAPTEPAGEMCKRLWQSVSPLRGITDLRMTNIQKLPQLICGSFIM